MDRFKQVYDKWQRFKDEQRAKQRQLFRAAPRFDDSDEESVLSASEASDLDLNLDGEAISEEEGVEESDIEDRVSDDEEPEIDEDEPGSTCMWFGMHKGTRFDELNHGYVQAMLLRCDNNPFNAKVS